MVAISVIIPVYNVEKQLDRCLHTVVNQFFDDYEVICINDGSTDSSPEILKKYAAKYKQIKVINQENKGLCIARNVGMDAVTGEYVLFADSDDYFTGFNTFNVLYNFAKKNNSDALIFDFMEGDDFGTISRISTIPLIYQLAGQAAFNAETASPEIYRYIPIGVWSKIYKADFIKDKRFEIVSYLEEGPFWDKVYTGAERINYLPAPFYFYVKNREGSITTNFGKKIFDIFKSFDYSIDIVKKSGYYEKLKDVMYVHMCSNLCFNAKRMNPEYREKYISAIRDYNMDINYSVCTTEKFFPFEVDDVLVVRFIKEHDFAAVEKLFKDHNLWKD